MIIDGMCHSIFFDQLMLPTKQSKGYIPVGYYFQNILQNYYTMIQYYNIPVGHKIATYQVPRQIEELACPKIFGLPNKGVKLWQAKMFLDYQKKNSTPIFFPTVYFMNVLNIV